MGQRNAHRRTPSQGHCFGITTAYFVAAFDGNNNAFTFNLGALTRCETNPNNHHYLSGYGKKQEDVVDKNKDEDVERLWTEGRKGIMWNRIEG